MNRWMLDGPLWGVPPSDPGPVVGRRWFPDDPPDRAVGLEAARYVVDDRPDETEGLEAQDRALEGALRSVLTPLECGVIRRRYWNGWTWDQIGFYYDQRGVFWPTAWALVCHDTALAKLRGALR